MKKKIITVITALFLSAAIYGAGGEYFSFLKLGVGARATGMGGAFTSLADDVAAIYYNPAGTLSLGGLEFMAETYVLSMGRSVNYIATAKPFVISGATYATGFAWINYSAGSDIEKRMTNSPEPDSRFSNNTHIFLFNVAVKMSQYVSVGGNFKLSFDTIDTQRGTGVGFDLGAIINIIEGLKVGISYNGIGTSVTWNNGPHIEAFPQVITTGISYKLIRTVETLKITAQPALDVVYNSFGGFSIKGGVESSINDTFFLRLGYNNAISLGAGINFKPSDIFSLKVDYGVVFDSIEPGATNHRIGVVILYRFLESVITGKKQASPDMGKDENEKVKSDDNEW